MDKRTDLVTMGGNPVTLLGNEVKPGDRAPDFTVLTGDLQPYSLKDAGSKIKIISVVPSLDTGVCEMQTLRFNNEALKLKDTVILTISVDLPFAQKRFCEAHSVENVVVLSDHRDLSFGMNYGFVMEEHRLLSRGIVVVDQDNIIRYVEYVKEVGQHPDYGKALEEAARLA
ncbi:MAG: thiol peroxidase [Caldicoprobacterales bacterium]|jgi:thiol peroxidase|nr:thiol peroxidase [Clostridiales bacterium]